MAPTEGRVARHERQWGCRRLEMIIGNGIPIPIGNPTGMGIDDIIGNEKEWESFCMRLGMTLITMEINSHRLMQYL